MIAKRLNTKVTHSEIWMDIGNINVDDVDELVYSISDTLEDPNSRFVYIFN